MTPTGPPYRAIFICFAAVASLTAFLFLPSEREKIALLERDGDLSAALTRIQQYLSAGKRDDFMLDAALRLQLRAGNMESAYATAQLIASSRPDSLAAQITLMRMIRERDEYDRYVSLAERVYDRWKDPDTLRELLTAYRLRQNTEAETRLLEAATVTGAASPAETERLGMLKAAQDDHAAAIRLLRYVDATRDGLHGNARMTLFELLIDQDRAEEAVRRAMKWLTTESDITVAAAFCAYLATARQLHLVPSIIRLRSSDVADVYIACVERIWNLGEENVAGQLLDGGIAESQIPTKEVAARLIQLALKLNRPELAIETWSRLTSHPLSPAICLGLALGAASVAREGRMIRIPAQSRYLLAALVPQLEAELLQHSMRQHVRGVALTDEVHEAEIKALRQFQTMVNGSIPVVHDLSGLGGCHDGSDEQ